MQYLESPRIDSPDRPVMKQVLLKGGKGEIDMMKDCSFFTQRDIYSGKTIWLLGTLDYTLNPFGKLTKKPSRHLPTGQVFKHSSYYHGFFVSLLCTEAFYNEHSEILKEYDVTDEKYYNKEHMPKWF